MQATIEEQGAYLSAFAEWRAASDEYHAAIVRLIDGDTLNVASMHAKAIELANLHSVCLERTTPLVS